jgi:hypothetical protein
MIHDWDQDYNSKWVEVIEDVVRDTIGSQRSRLGVGSRTETTIVDLLDGEKEENCASSHSATGVLNKVVGPVHFSGITTR